MGTFTLELWEALEYTGGTWRLDGANTILVGGDIGLNHYEIFDESYRDILNGRIFDRYMNSEIGMETVDMFKLAMRRSMNEIMPIYNRMYEAERLKFDPLRTMDIRTLGTSEARSEATTRGSSETTTETDSGSRTVSSDTPQSQLAGDADYATSGVDATSKSVSGGTGVESGESTNEGTTEQDSHVTGYQGSPADLILAYRNSLISVDMMIANELRDCFMMIYGSNDMMSDPGTFERYT